MEIPSSVAISLFKKAVRALEKLADEITKEESEKEAVKFAKEIHEQYLKGHGADSAAVQIILGYLKNLNIDIGSLNLPQPVKTDLLNASAKVRLPLDTSTDIRAALKWAEEKAAKLPKKPTAKKAVAKKPAAKKVAAKRGAAKKPATKRVSAKKPAAKKVAAKKPAAKKVAAHRAFAKR